MSVLTCTCTAATFHSVSFSKPNPVWFGKVTPKNYVQFSKPIPLWFGKKKNDFARRRFKTKFRLVWKILMTIVNVLQIPNQIQFGLEKSLIEYSVEYRSVGWSWHTIGWTSLHCSEVSVVHSCPEDSSTLPSPPSSTPRNTQWLTLVSSHHGRLHAQHRCIALRTPLNI